jgi:hypothetical protein
MTVRHNAKPELLHDAYSIHFHVFTEFEVLELLSVLNRKYYIAFLTGHIANNNCHETVVVARKEYASRPPFSVMPAGLVTSCRVTDEAPDP